MSPLRIAEVVGPGVVLDGRGVGAGADGRGGEGDYGQRGRALDAVEATVTRGDFAEAVAVVIADQGDPRGAEQVAVALVTGEAEADLEDRDEVAVDAQTGEVGGSRAWPEGQVGVGLAVVVEVVLAQRVGQLAGGELVGGGGARAGGGRIAGGVEGGGEGRREGGAGAGAGTRARARVEAGADIEGWRCRRSRRRRRGRGRRDREGERTVGK